MGASGSKPKVVPIDNPNPRHDLKNSALKSSDSIEISVEVAQRLQDAKKDFVVSQNTSHTNIRHDDDMLMNDVHIPGNLLKKSAQEVEKQQYNETKKRLDKMYGEPINLPEEDIKQIAQMRKNLFLCYKNNPRESLRCNALSEAFQSYVYKEQLSYILKLKEESNRKRLKESDDDSGDSLKKLKPGTCGATKGGAGESHISTGIKVSGHCRGPSDLDDVSNVWKKN